MKNEVVYDDGLPLVQEEISMAIKQEIDIKEDYNQEVKEIIKTESEIKVEAEVAKEEEENEKKHEVMENSNEEKAEMLTNQFSNKTNNQGEPLYSNNEDMAVLALTEFLSTNKFDKIKSNLLIFKIISDHLVSRTEESVKKRYQEHLIQNKYGGPFLVFKIDLLCQLKGKVSQMGFETVFLKKMNEFVAVLTSSDLVILKCSHASKALCITAQSLQMTYKEESEFGIDIDLLVYSIKKYVKGAKQVNLANVDSILRKCGINFHPENRLPMKNLQMRSIKSVNKSDHVDHDEQKTTIGNTYDVVECGAILAMIENLKKYNTENNADMNIAKIVSSHLIGRNEDSIRQFMRVMEKCQHKSIGEPMIPVSIIIKAHHNKFDHQKGASLSKVILMVSGCHAMLLKCSHASEEPCINAKSLNMLYLEKSEFGINIDLLSFSIKKYAIGAKQVNLANFDSVLRKCKINFHPENRLPVPNVRMRPKKSVHSNTIIVSRPQQIDKFEQNKTTNISVDKFTNEHRAIFAMSENIKKYNPENTADINIAKIVSNHLEGTNEYFIRQFMEKHQCMNIGDPMIPVSIIVKKESKFILMLSRGSFILLKCNSLFRDPSPFRTSWKGLESFTTSVKTDSVFGIDELQLFYFLSEISDLQGIIPKDVVQFCFLLDKWNIKFLDHSKSNALMKKEPVRLVKLTSSNAAPSQASEPKYNIKEDEAILALVDVLSKNPPPSPLSKILSHHLGERGDISISKRYSSICRYRPKLINNFLVFKVGLLWLEERERYPQINTYRHVIVLTRYSIILLQCREPQNSCIIPAKYLEISHLVNSEFGLDTNILLDFIKKNADQKYKYFGQELRNVQVNDLEVMLRRCEINFHPDHDATPPVPPFHFRTKLKNKNPIT